MTVPAFRILYLELLSDSHYVKLVNTPGNPSYLVSYPVMGLPVPLDEFVTWLLENHRMGIRLAPELGENRVTLASTEDISKQKRECVSLI